MSNLNSQILKSFGFEVPEAEAKSSKPTMITLIIKTGQHYRFKTPVICKISAYISSMFAEEKKYNETDDKVELPSIIDEKFMLFLLDYADYIEKHGVPAYNTEKIKAATTLENAVGTALHVLFIQHFDYKFMRSDLAVKQYLNIFGHFLECSTAIVADPLIALFAIAHKIIIQHLPGSEFIIIDD